MIKSNKLLFDESATEFVLEAFGKGIDKEGYLIDTKTNQRVLTPDGEQILKEDFGGIAKNKSGVTIFIKNDVHSLMKFVEGGYN